MPASLEMAQSFYRALTDAQLDHSYAEGKWTIRESLQHVIDTERIFAYRLFRISRHDKTPLPGFNQDDYVSPARAHLKSKEQLLNEHEVVRRQSIVLLDSLSDSDLNEVGTSSDHPTTGAALAFMILGHEIWHMDIIKEKYL